MLNTQTLTDKAQVLVNLVKDTDFSGRVVGSVHDAIVGELLSKAVELGISLDREPFASLGNRQFTSGFIPDEIRSLPWYKHVHNFCMVEDSIQDLSALSSVLCLDGFRYCIVVNSKAGARTYYINEKYICDCTGTPTLQDFKNLFYEKLENSVK